MKRRRIAAWFVSVVLATVAAIGVGAGTAGAVVGPTKLGDRITYWFWADDTRVYATAHNVVLTAEFYSLDRKPLIGPIQRRFDTTVLLPGQRIASTISSPTGSSGCAIAINGRIKTQVNVYRAHQTARCR
ncbi:hypothetical protein [Gordonia sp. C13]|uniref:hypothetical protein n=1 Tax=Gordonia sp. C13 TaxID=2935078 RepID=UPI00200AEFF1|nr:hypothetical protein [Gordonia sp. C13]MCK8616207.1 hypothetical protein [Gordonia sp. C13]